MKYMVITSKHHDGFSMFDTKYSDFSIVRSTPYKHDPMKDLAEACRKVGIKFCFYYSIADWHNTDSPAEYSQRGFHGNPKDDADVSKYADYMRNRSTSCSPARPHRNPLVRRRRRSSAHPTGRSC